MRARGTVGTLLVLLFAVSIRLEAADPPSPALALSFRPVQKDVEYDTPARGDFEKCTVRVEREGKRSGWVVLSPEGLALRRFVDTNGDNVVDHWRYYQGGLEVYRDLDSDFNNKVDQSRWLNTAGSRWALDANEDGRIDGWKVLSAQEAGREAVRALVTGDVALLRTLLVSADDVKALGLEAELAKKVMQSVSEPEKKLKAARSDTKTVAAETQWMRFDAGAPSVVPADDGKADRDLYVYENAIAIVETKNQPGLIQLGELVRVGDVWKLTQVPQPLGESTEVAAGGLLMQPPIATVPTAATTDSLSPEAQKLLAELQELDKNSPSAAADAEALGRYNAKRADLLQQLVAVSRSEAEREQWTRQMVDGLAAAVQTGGYPAGLKRLETIEADLARASGRSDLAAYVKYRRMLSRYSLDLQSAAASTEERQKLQEAWLAQLEAFAKEHPQAEDVPAAMFQLAMAQEFAGNLKEARRWYDALVDKHAASDAGRRASGAIRRIDLEGKPLEYSGPGLKGGAVDLKSFRGKVLLVRFWSTWCKPCTEDLPQIRALYQQYRADGFEIVDVNLDTTTEPVADFMAKHGITWPQIHEPGGLESRPGKAFGIVSLPTMFLIGRDGKVVSRSTSVAALKEKLPELLKAR
ncbi:MAG: redoxin domain-containing protein [Planctomycetes bacterium]|nr:redoxin domain-containing protein [Planctomycetota bacterium]